MKRNEMIYKLIGHVADVTNQMVKFNEDEADLLLTFIEQSGMKPPTLSSDKCQKLMQIYIDPSFNMWDETYEKTMATTKRRT
jgi:hypothetical protein